MMLVEGTSLTVNQWGRKLRAAKWCLCSSEDGHHWVGVRKAHEGTTIRKLVDGWGSEHQKIWYTVFDVEFGYTSTGRPVWKGGQQIPPHGRVHCTSTMPLPGRRVDHAELTSVICCSSVRAFR